MKRTISILAAAAFLLAAGYALADTASDQPGGCCGPGAACAMSNQQAAKPPAKPQELKCPVTGQKVTDLKNAPKSVYKGKTYYFCCAGCKPLFDKNPEKYIKPAPAKQSNAVICPVMGGVVKNPKTAPKSVYKGKTYYFCCAGCKPQFDKNPEKYVKSDAKTRTTETHKH